VTFVRQKTCDQGTLHTTTVSRAGHDRRPHLRAVRPEPVQRRNGFVQVTYSAVTSLTVAAYSE
jgi:hypothetical protein